MLNKENQIVFGTGSKVNKEHRHDVIKENEVTESVNVADNDFNPSKENFWKIFGHFKIISRKRKCFQEEVDNVIHNGQC